MHPVTRAGIGLFLIVTGVVFLLGAIACGFRHQPAALPIAAVGLVLVCVGILIHAPAYRELDAPAVPGICPDCNGSGFGGGSTSATCHCSTTITTEARQSCQLTTGRETRRTGVDRMPWTPRPTSAGLLGVNALCRECGWHSQARNAQGNAARHYDATKHTVDVESTMAVTYGNTDASHPHEREGGE